MKFLIDSNFFMLLGKQKVDIFECLKEEFGKAEFYTLDMVIMELKKISEGRGKNSASAKLALQMVKKKKVKVLKAKGRSTDKEIEKAAEESGFIVCTQDKKLIRELKRKKIRCIYLLERNRKPIII